MIQSSRRVTLSCLAAIAIGLLLLWWLPSRISSRSFQFESTPNPVVFPLDETFVVLTTGKSGRASLRDFLKDHPQGVLVNFWATWCQPCIEELPSLESLYRATQQDPKHWPLLVAISVDAHAEDVARLRKAIGFALNFPILFDPQGAYSLKRGTNKFPETYWIGAQGQVRYHWVGPQDWLSPSVTKIIETP